MALGDLISAIQTSHRCELALSSAADQLDAFENRTGFSLPSDLRAFYLKIHRAEIAGGYRLLPVEHFERTGSALQGVEWADSEPPSWYAFCDVDDGDFVGIELERSVEGHHRIFDCDHEDVSTRSVIAVSFSDFLQRALSAGGRLYYLGEGRFPTIEVPYRPPVAYLRRQYEKWSHDPEVGPRVCVVDGCGRLCVSLSVHCRRHHFEAIQRVPYPFDE